MKPNMGTRKGAAAKAAPNETKKRTAGAKASRADGAREVKSEPKPKSTAPTHASSKSKVAKKPTVAPNEKHADVVEDRIPSKVAVAATDGEVPAQWKDAYDRLLRLREFLLGTKAPSGTEDEEMLEFVSDPQRTLAEIDAAVERIFRGTYGICEVTGKPIAPGRLEIMPYTRYSVEGQQQRDARKPRSGGTSRWDDDSEEEDWDKRSRDGEDEEDDYSSYRFGDDSDDE